MPIYEYQCSACRHEFDCLQKVNERPLTHCPECHQQTVIRLVSAAGFQLKGTGWYVTDFKNKGQEKARDAKPSAKDNTGAANSKQETAVSSNTSQGGAD